MCRSISLPNTVFMLIFLKNKKNIYLSHVYFIITFANVLYKLIIHITFLIPKLTLDGQVVSAHYFRIIFSIQGTF